MKTTQIKNKKAQWSTMQKFIVAAVLILLLLIISKRTVFGADTQLKDIRLAQSNDYDHDKIVDANDASPCVYGQEIVLQSGSSEVYYYVTEAYTTVSGSTEVEDYFCPDDEKTQDGKVLIIVKDSETNKMICSLSASDCKDLLSDKYEELRNEN